MGFRIDVLGASGVAAGRSISFSAAATRLTSAPFAAWEAAAAVGAGTAGRLPARDFFAPEECALLQGQYAPSRRCS